MNHVIFNDCVSLGDALVSFPGTLALAERRRNCIGRRVAIRWTNEAVGSLFPHEKYGFIQATDYDAQGHERISIHDMVHYGLKRPSQHLHPTAQFMAHVGFPERSDRVHRPEINYPKMLGVKTYDVLISPYVLAEMPRFWPLDRWQVVINWLNARHRAGDFSLGVLTGTKMPSSDDLRKINPYEQSHFAENARVMTHTLTGVEYIIDRPLTEVAYLMSRAKLVITVDSGPSRLMHAVGGTHLLLCSNHVALDWGTYPEAHVLYGDLHRLTAHAVIEAAAKLLS